MSNYPHDSCDNSAAPLPDASFIDFKDIEDVQQRLAEYGGVLIPASRVNEAVKARNDLVTYRSIDIEGFCCAAMLNGCVAELLAEPFKLQGLEGNAKYEIRSAGHKGLGMFATTDVPAQAPILVEHPAIVMPAQTTAVVTNPVTYQIMLDLLQPHVQEEFLTLANCKSPELCGTVEGITRTNGIGITLSVPEGLNIASQYRGVFLKTSRCNHSCDANAAWKWSAELFALTLYAERPIQAGEEITVSYAELDSWGEARRRKLKAWYKIDCECPICVPGPDELARCAAIALKFSHILKSLTFRDWCFNSAMPEDALFHSHKRCIDLIKRERLPYEMRLPYLLDLVSYYAALGRAEMVRHWARETLYEFGGSDFSQLKPLHIWLTWPHKHPLWKLREKVVARST